jgi:hypothetical protein
MISIVVGRLVTLTMERVMLATGCTLATSGLMVWGLLAAICAHEFEEFVWPGGFRSWYIRYSPHVERSMTKRFLLIVNTAVPLAAAIAAAFFTAPWARFLWLVVASGIGINGAWHIQATVRGHRYSPGAVTGALLYLPLAMYAYSHFVSCDWVAPRSALTAAAYGAIYWILSEGRKLLNREQRETSTPHLSVLR